MVQMGLAQTLILRLVWTVYGSTCGPMLSLSSSWKLWTGSLSARRTPTSSRPRSTSNQNRLVTSCCLSHRQQHQIHLYCTTSTLPFHPSFLELYNHDIVVAVFFLFVYFTFIIVVAAPNVVFSETQHIFIYFFVLRDSAILFSWPRGPRRSTPSEQYIYIYLLHAALKIKCPANV